MVIVSNPEQYEQQDTTEKSIKQDKGSWLQK